jgi:hypothetical protein
VIDTRGDDVTRRWSPRLLAGVLVGAALLSGCAQKQQASETLPSASASPTEDTLPPLGPEDLPMPPEARTQDAAGAEAFVRYYIALINRTSDVMDAEPLREFSDGCSECERLARNTEEAAAAGHDYEDGAITIVELGRPLVDSGSAQLALRVDQAEFRVVDAGGKAVDGSDAYSNISTGVALNWEASRSTWTMAQLTFG